MALGALIGVQVTMVCSQLVGIDTGRVPQTGVETAAESDRRAINEHRATGGFADDLGAARIVLRNAT